MERDPQSIESPTSTGEPISLVVWQIVRRRKYRIAMTVLAALFLVWLYHQITGPWYEATAQVMVLKKHLQTSPISGPTGSGEPAEDYLPTHMLIITSPRVVKAAVTDKGLLSIDGLQQVDPVRRSIRSASTYLFGEGPKGAPEHALTKSIVGSLKVSSEIAKPGATPSREVLNLSFQGKNPQDCSKVLSAVIASYQDFLGEACRSVNKETLLLVGRARDGAQRELDSKEAAYREFRRQAPLLLRVHQDRLFNINDRQTQLRMRHSEIKATLARIHDAQESGRSYAELLEMVTGLPSNREIFNPQLAPTHDVAAGGKGARDTLEEQLVNLQLEERKLRQQGLGPDHPDVKGLRDRMQSVRAMIAPSTNKAGPDQNQKDWIEGFVKLKVRLLEQELSDNEQTEKALAALFDQDQKEAKDAMLHQIEDDAYRANIERSKLLYESIDKRYQELETVRDYSGYDTHVLADPEGRLLEKKYLMFFGGALLLALPLGLAWGWLAEVRDKSFRTELEVCQRLGLPVLGHILPPPPRRRSKQAEQPLAPVFSVLPRQQPAADAATGARESRLDPVLTTFHEANSREAEAYRAIRISLYFSNGNEPRKVIQITSPSSGDGKTTFTANLGISMAQSGKKVLLIDADFRRPRLHTLFGLENRLGLATLLGGSANLTGAIQRTEVPGLSVLASGQLPANPADLLTSPRLQEFLKTARRDFDFVLVDTPPLLAVTDPCVVAPRVDGVVLTIRNGKRARLHAELTKDRLERLGARVLGAVVSGVPEEVGSSGYEYERYAAQPVAQ